MSVVHHGLDDGSDARHHLWVPNSSSTAMTSSFTRRWRSGVIVYHGGAIAVSERPAAGGVAWSSGLCLRWRQPTGHLTRQLVYDQRLDMLAVRAATVHCCRIGWGEQVAVPRPATCVRNRVDRSRFPVCGAGSHRLRIITQS